MEGQVCKKRELGKRMLHVTQLAGGAGTFQKLVLQLEIATPKVTETQKCGGGE